MAPHQHTFNLPTTNDDGFFSPTLVIASVFLVAVAVGTTLAIKFARALYETSRANEWLLIIQDGVQKKAGIGMTAWRGLTQQAVRFPSAVNKCHFSATQVSKEMQGVKISGFVVWSVYREGDGPFRYYRNLGGDVNAANAQIKDMVETIMRHQVSNHSINEVMTQRDTLRAAVKSEMSEVVQGWGVWLETAEITDVTICSRTLFEDLQAEFRQDTALTAERIRQETHQKTEAVRLATNAQVTEQRLATEIELAKKQEDSVTQRASYTAQQKLRREEEEAKLFDQQMVTARAKLEQERELQLQEIERSHAVESARLAKELERARQREEEELAATRRRLAVESEWGQASMAKYQIDSLERIYSRLPLKDIRVSNFMSEADSKDGGMGGLLPGLQRLSNAWTVVQEEAK